MTASNSMSSFWKLIIAVGICEATGILSAFISQTANNAWFDALNKPSWNPPAYLFAPVWTTLYLLMGIALWLVWKSNSPESQKKFAIFIFAIQLFFNFWWSILFFRIHSPAIALVDILLMVITIILSIFSFAATSRTAAWLLVPYLAWVSFATFLNYTIWSIN